MVLYDDVMLESWMNWKRGSCKFLLPEPGPFTFLEGDHYKDNGDFGKTHFFHWFLWHVTSCACLVSVFFQDGLAHISAIAAGRVEKVSDFLDVGDKVWAKVRLFCVSPLPLFTCNSKCLMERCIGKAWLVVVFCSDRTKLQGGKYQGRGREVWSGFACLDAIVICWCETACLSHVVPSGYADSIIIMSALFFSWFWYI